MNEACAALADGTAAILSGGTDFFPTLCDRPPPTRILDLTLLRDLAAVTQGPGETRIGARVTWSELVATDLPPVFDALKAAAREVGSIQIQNVATLAGNLCNASPAADGVPPLLALDASVELSSTGRVRRLGLAEFLHGNRRTAMRPDEMMTAIVVPGRLQGGRSAFRKLGARRHLVISIVMVAAIVDADDTGIVRVARVAVGSCSAVARRLESLEAALVGADATHGLAHLVTREHLASISPIDDLRATAPYRADAALTLVGRTLDACCDR